MAKVKPVPEGHNSVSPYLIVDGAERALEFYKRAFGATELMRHTGPEGKVGHAEVRIGDTVVMLADENPDHDIRPVADQFYGDRLGTFEDPFGHTWHLSSHIEDVSMEELGRRAEAAMKEKKS